MKVKLFDFQEDALERLRDKVATARQYASPTNPQAISFSAPTGSGKTIMLTALFEDILFGADEFAAQQDAVILWISDMPELNEQTRLKIEGKSSKIRTRQLVTVGPSFDEERFPPGQIYFLNTQKLGENKLLTETANKRKFTIWQTLTNTALASPSRLYVIIDEAHRGMREGKVEKEAAKTILQRFIKGSDEHELIRMPMVIGVSATPKRFDDLLSGTAHTVHKVPVPAEQVRKSGLIKDRILIHYPDAATGTEMSLLAEAVAQWQRMTKSWHVFCDAQNPALERVKPILVGQVEDGKKDVLTRTDLAVTLRMIEETLGRKLWPDEVVHTFNDTADVAVDGRTIKHVDASRIEEDKRISFVLFKMSLTTGWDCPRAEVMMSFRRAHDHTYIAQLLGRMVRAPLAARIEKDASLNDVHLFLPHFDQGAVEAVIRDLHNVEDVPPAETGTSRELVTLKRRDDAQEVFEAIAELVTYRVDGVRKQSSLRRLIGIARALTFDGLDEVALERTHTLNVAWMYEEIKRLQGNPTYAERVKHVTDVGVKSIAVANVAEAPPTPTTYTIDTVEADIDVQFAQAGRRLTNGLHMKYWETQSDRDSSDVKVDIVLLVQDETAMQNLEKLAEDEFNRLYEANKRAIGKLTELRRSQYERLRLAAATPFDIPWNLPDSIGFRRKTTDPELPRHLYVEPSGVFRADLQKWERGVLDQELGDTKTPVVAWLRNIDRQQWSLEIPYREGGAIKPMFPDLLLVRKDAKGFSFDILEPHDPSLGDNNAKARGLADFAERHGHLFRRIDLIRRQRSPAGIDKYYRLNVNKLSVRNLVRASDSNNRLDEIFKAEAE